MNAIIDNEAVDAHAGLALMQKLVEYGGLDRLFQIGIIQYHERAFPPSSSSSRFNVGPSAANFVKLRPIGWKLQNDGRL